MKALFELYSELLQYQESDNRLYIADSLSVTVQLINNNKTTLHTINVVGLKFDLLHARKNLPQAFSNLFKPKNLLILSDTIALDSIKPLYEKVLESYNVLDFHNQIKFIGFFIGWFTHKNRISSLLAKFPPATQNIISYLLGKFETFFKIEDLRHQQKLSPILAYTTVVKELTFKTSLTNNQIKYLFKALREAKFISDKTSFETFRKVFSGVERSLLNNDRIDWTDLSTTRKKPNAQTLFTFIFLLKEYMPREVYRSPKETELLFTTNGTPNSLFPKFYACFSGPTKLNTKNRNNPRFEPILVTDRQQLLKSIVDNMPPY